jgi:HAD superfamily hydrolase (TIGR01484 family)
MYILALAADYDGTIAHHSVVDEATCKALQRLRESGRRLILVTGRALPDLKRVFPQIKLFDIVVAENGGLLYDPATEQERTIAPPPPIDFVAALEQRNVRPLTVGRSIVATWEPNGATVLEVIRDLGLELQIIFNKGAVMVLPPGVNKASGLAAALRELELSTPNVVGVGDAENDHAFLRSCACAAAVANALPAVKAEADIRLAGDHGRGVIELVDAILREDARVIPRHRYALLVGLDREDRPVAVEPYHGSVLIAGSSGIGKSTLATALTERILEKSLEFCVFDPEGDYGELQHAVSIGDAKTAPNSETALKLLLELTANVVVNTQALGVQERPSFFAKLLPQIASLKARTGRPHWLIIDEAHHLLAARRDDITQVLPDKMPAAILVTVHPGAVAPEVLQSVDYVLALGDDAPQTIAAFCDAVGIASPPQTETPQPDEILFWERRSGAAPIPVKAIAPRQSRSRHLRKYAEGELGEDVSFYFRGPGNKLNLRAQNLTLFGQIASGVDEDTWEHHRRAGDYSRWFRDVIKDEALAQIAARIESDPGLGASASRDRIVEEVSRRYTAPARAPHG